MQKTTITPTVGNSRDDLDVQSENLLTVLANHERTRGNKVAGVRTVLVVLSAAGMVFDMETLRQKILMTYPEAAVFFRTTSGKAVAAPAPQRVDLLIDFTGPRQRQGWFYPKKLRSIARVAVGRNAGLFRGRTYDRVFDEKAKGKASPELDFLARERYAQREVLALAGVAVAPMGSPTADLGHTIALELPSMQKL